MPLCTRCLVQELTARGIGVLATGRVAPGARLVLH